MSEHFITECPYGEVRLQDAIWYHTFDFNRNVKGITTEFDLYPSLGEFLLPADMTGKTFLDIGTANGFFSFEMERRGATVTSFDLGLDQDFGHIPYPGSPDRSEGSREFTKGFHKGYWYAHKHFNSRARVAYGNVMKLPSWLGMYDVVLLGSILQHLRDPLGAILEADRHVKETLILCEAYYESSEPVMRLQSEPEAPAPQFWTWWAMSPALLVLAMKTLGYRDIEVNGPFDLIHARDQYPVRTVAVRGHK